MFACWLIIVLYKQNVDMKSLSFLVDAYPECKVLLLSSFAINFNRWAYKWSGDKQNICHIS